MSLLERLAHAEALLHQYMTECFELRRRITEMQQESTRLIQRVRELERKTDA